MKTGAESTELISPSVLVGKAVANPAPEYPWLARSLQVCGDVAVDITVDEAGKVIAAKAFSGHFLLKSAAVEAAYRARFTPTLLSGHAVKVKGSITYKFKLEHE